MVGEAAVSVVAAAAYLVVRRRSPEPDRVEATEVGELRRVWTDPVLRRIAVLAFLGFGVFIALTTWLQALLEPRGVSEAAAGTIITVAVAVGAVGSTVVAAAFERGAVEVAILRTALVVAGGCVVLAVTNGVAGRAGRGPGGARHAERAAVAGVAVQTRRANRRWRVRPRCSGWPATSAGWWSPCWSRRPRRPSHGGLHAARPDRGRGSSAGPRPRRRPG